MRKLTVMFIVLSAAFASSCVTRGKNFSSDTSWIRVDDTKQQEVQQRLGQPFAVGASNTGPSWTYGYYRHNIFGKSLTKELKLSWNDDGSVRVFTFSSSFPEDKQRLIHGD